MEANKEEDAYAYESSEYTYRDSSRSPASETTIMQKMSDASIANTILKMKQHLAKRKAEKRKVANSKQKETATTAGDENGKEKNAKKREVVTARQQKESLDVQVARPTQTEVPKQKRKRSRSNNKGVSVVRACPGRKQRCQAEESEEKRTLQVESSVVRPKSPEAAPKEGAASALELYPR